MASRPQPGGETAAERQARFEALQYMHTVFAAADATAVRRGVGVPAQAPMPSPVLRITAPEMDFALDDPVARRLLQAASGTRGNTEIVASWAASCPAVPFRGPIATVGPTPFPIARPPGVSAGQTVGSYFLNGFDSPTLDATLGGGNVLGNAFGVYQALDHTAGRAVFEIQQARAVERIMSGAQQSARINSMVQIYDANAPARATALRNGTVLTTAQAQPRLRVKLGSLPMEILDARLGARLQRDVIGAARGASNFTQKAQVLVSRAVVEAEWTQRMRFMSTRTFGGILAFGPSAVIDASASMRGGSFDGREFLVRSARSQSLNVIGFAAGAGAVFLAGLVTVGAAPIVIIGLVAGVAVQALADRSGLDEAAERAMTRAVGR